MKLPFAPSLRWFLAGLAQTLPNRWRRFALFTEAAVQITLNDDQVVLRGRLADGQPAARFSRNPASISDIERWRRQQVPPDANWYAELPADRTLCKTMSLPTAARGDVDELLRHEVARITPFEASEICVAYRLTTDHSTSERMTCELIVARRADVERLVEGCRTLGIALHGVLPADAPDPTFNLLVAGRRAPESLTLSNRTLASTVAALTLVLVALYTPVVVQKKAIADLEAHIRVAREEAESVAAMQRHLEMVDSHLQQLLVQRREQPLVIELLREITVRLPDHTWLTRLDYRDGQLDMRGESTESSELVRLLEGSDHFSDARFRSPTARNPRTGTDRFHVVVQVRGAT